MARELLRVNYRDAAWNGQRKFQRIDNEDGTVSLPDVTDYTVKDDSFYGALDLNKKNVAVNEIMVYLERGTNIYSDFDNYFASKKAAVEGFVNGLKDELQTAGDDAKDDLQNRVDAINDELTNRSASYWNDFQRRSDPDGFINECETTLSTFVNGKQDEFNTWFDHMKDQIGTNPEVNIRNEIEEHEARLALLEKMVIQNDIYAPINLNVGSGNPVPLVEDNDEAIIASWRYAYKKNGGA